MKLALEGARVIITAGASGIGRAILDGFIEEGATVATCDIDRASWTRCLRAYWPGMSMSATKRRCAAFWMMPSARLAGWIVW